MIPLFVWLAAAAPAAPPLHAPAPVVRVEETWAALSAEYAAAYDAWKERLSTTEDRTERRKLRKAHPASVFAERYVALADAGEGRALLWQLEHLRHIGVPVREREAGRQRLYERLFTEHTTMGWFGDALTQAWGDRKRLGDALPGWLETTVQASEYPEVQAQARYYLAYEDARAEDEEARKRGFTALDALVADLPDTEWADRAAADLFQLRDRAVGAVALDFEGKTVDGETFRLSDFQGKVVLLDFWGFW